MWNILVKMVRLLIRLKSCWIYVCVLLWCKMVVILFFMVLIEEWFICICRVFVWGVFF